MKVCYICSCTSTHMSNRFLEFGSIGYGANILPWIFIDEKQALEQVVDFPLDTKTYPVTFYGITEMPSRHSIFYYLMKNNLSRMEDLLTQNQDLIYIQPYGSIRTNSRSSYRITTKCQLWNGVNLLELAYLLENQDAITILKYYGRKRWHSQGNYSTIYGTKAIDLAIVYHKPHIADALALEM